MNLAENIQEGYGNRSKQQKLLLNSITVNNNYLREPCAYQRACEVKLPEPRLIARSQLGRFLQNVKTTNFRD